MEYIALIITSVVVGLTVSLDVSVLTLTSGHDHIRRHGRLIWSFIHAFWHALFLSIGLGVFHILIKLLGKLIQTLMPQLTLLLQKSIDSLKEISAIWAAHLVNMLEAIKDNLILIPEVIGASAAVILCIYFYRKKLKIQSGEIDEVDVGFSSAFERFGRLNYLAVLVAMDMWYVTPALRNLVIDPSDAVSGLSAVIHSVVFILILFFVVFCFVFYISGIATKTTSKIPQIAEEQCYTQCIARYIMVILEPIGVFYFVSYAVLRVFNDSIGHSSVHLIVAVAVVSIMLKGRNKKIIYALARQCSNNSIQPTAKAAAD